MPFQPAPSCVQSVIEGRMDNQLTILDLSWFASGAITITSLNNLVVDIGTWVTTNLGPLLSRDWSSVRVRAWDLTTATGLTAEVAVAVTGGVDVEAAPNNVAACVSLRSEQRGRGGRGRNFVPGIPNSVITLNTLDTGFVTDLLGAYFLLVGAGTFSAGFQLVVIHRVEDNVPLANGIGIPIVNTTMVGSSVRSMRSREIGHGA
jgi:hypothetical protein